ncbi:hypothetical protein NQ314_020140 [Rhamnusium bicolor]|uniref:SAC3/GANP/THP3 conserved domain-containing protein n=1 Tax=Rhamnusium bicolor TaxID=1586634 RepID=A0AAV8WME7_9CUCU|nr:hypothetical protein NQ314_020140 [Rhamnusium bicolor]
MEPLNDYVVGKCMGMCPPEEIKMRERERLLHILEIVPGTENDRIPKADINRMVKSFARSAVGNSMQEPKNLRPPGVLLKTISYLFDDVISRNDVPWTVVYDFLMDRLRSVRQDMVIQNISRAHYISCLQPIIRFYAYASYRLCEEDINTFDPFINKTHLQECLKRLLCMYDDYDELNKVAENVFDDLLIENRPHFEALYIVVNIGNPAAILRALNLPRGWRTDLVEISLELSLCYSNSNFIRACRIIKILPTFLSAVASLHLPEIRRNALKIMSVAYSSKNLLYPVGVLKELLLYDTDLQIVNDCKYYGLEIQNNGIHFSKSSFDENKVVMTTADESCAAERSYREAYGVKYSSSIPTSSFRPGTLQNNINLPPGVSETVKKMKMSQTGVLYTLHTLREPIVEYQETRGVPRSEQVAFVALITSLCTQAYTAAITILVMLWNLAPLLDGFVYFARFLLDKLIDILETEDQKEKIMKAAVFAGEIIVVMFIIFLILGLIFMPVYVLTAKIISKIWGMIAW